MAFDFKAALKKKPVRYALIAIVCVGAVFIIRSRASSSAASNANSASGLTDAQAADQTQLAEQQNAIEAQQQAQQTSIAASQAQQAQSDQTALTALNAQDATAITEQQNQIAGNEALAGIQLQGLKDQLDSADTQQAAQLNATISLANISAGESESLASTQANENVAINQSNNQTTQVESGNQLAAAQSSNQAQVQIAQANHSGGGCFITSAVCEASGLPDDCKTLTVLRRFRDTYMQSTPELCAMVATYYKTAPDIVARIKARKDADAIFGELRKQIDIAVGLIELGDNETAMKTYSMMMYFAGGIPA